MRPNRQTQPKVLVKAAVLKKDAAQTKFLLGAALTLGLYYAALLVI
ncbi:MAG: hypothetical protein KTR14_04535 [Vampirovibrio sp.]|nr:hypothetical protein [Vampirovibrio sp.]